MAPPRRISISHNLIEALIAVIVGNALYFLVLRPYLLQNARHKVYRIDLGLGIDFWLCAACFGLVKLIWRFKKHP